MLTLMYLLTRSLFAVAFQWGRLGLLVAVIGGVTAGGELLLPDSGVVGLLSRTVALAAIPAVLVLVRFFEPEEVVRLRALVARLRPARVA